jgi:plasmid stability protein
MGIDPFKDAHSRQDWRGLEVCVIMQPYRFHYGSIMPTTLTLKNIPDAVYERLKSSAELHRRSLNSEVIVCLETVLLPSTVPATERLARVREIRALFAGQKFLPAEIDAAKRAGRP